MALRWVWEFPYKASEVLTAALAKHEYHATRLAHWQNELDAADKDLRENGIDIRNAVDLNTTSNSYHAQPVLDNQKVKRINECNAKIAEHRDLTDEFARFIRVLERDTEATLNLQAEDVKFFGL